MGVGMATSNTFGGFSVNNVLSVCEHVQSSAVCKMENEIQGRKNSININFLVRISRGHS